MTHLWTPPRLARHDARRALLFGASALLHLAVLAPMTVWFVAERYDAPPVPPTIYLEIEPRPLLPDERPRPPVAAPQDSQAPAPVSAATADRAVMIAPAETASPRPLDEERDRDRSRDVPSPPNPRIAAPAPAGVPSGAAPGTDDPWRVQTETQAGRNARALRTGPVGCRNPDLLSASERAICDERFNERAAQAAPITGSGNAARDARFAREGARALADYEARRRPLSGGTGVLPPADCPGSNFGTGCAGAYMPDVPGVDMRQGATTTHNGGQRSNKQQSR